jgi:hypothetical protein
VDLHPFAPRYKRLTLPEGTKGKLIGPGGATIKRIQATCKAELQVGAGWLRNRLDGHAHYPPQSPAGVLTMHAWCR